MGRRQTSGDSCQKPALNRDQVRRESHNRGGAAVIVESHLYLGTVAMGSHPVGAHPFGHFPEQQLLFQRSAGSGYTRETIGHDPGRLYQSFLQKRGDRQQCRSGITTRRGDPIGALLGAALDPTKQCIEAGAMTVTHPTTEADLTSYDVTVSFAL